MNTNGAKGSRSKKRHMRSSEDRVRGGTPLSTPKTRIGSYEKLFGASTRRHHKQITEGKYFILDEFKKAKPPTFDGEVKKVEDEKVWLLGIKRYFRIQNYSDNMNSRVAIFSLKGKADIWWEELMNVKDIKEEEL